MSGLADYEVHQAVSMVMFGPLGTLGGDPSDYGTDTSTASYKSGYATGFIAGLLDPEDDGRKLEGRADRALGCYSFAPATPVVLADDRKGKAVGSMVEGRDIHDLPVPEWGEIGSDVVGSVVDARILCVHPFGVGPELTAQGAYGHVNPPRVTDPFHGRRNGKAYRRSSEGSRVGCGPRSAAHSDALSVSNPGRLTNVLASFS